MTRAALETYLQTHRAELDESQQSGGRLVFAGPSAIITVLPAVGRPGYYRVQRFESSCAC